jgi:type III pantothenate kinase
VNLVIDIGNTKTKLAVFSNQKMVQEKIVDELTVELIQSLQNQHINLNKAILSSVKDFSEDVKAYLFSAFDQFIELEKETPIPLSNKYETPETLGKDRLAAAVGANGLFPDTNCLVIDVGTAITIDLVSAKNEYLGGNISPGLEMRYKALNHFTSKLPLLSKNEEFTFIGKNTNQAIHNGAINGIIFEIEGYALKLEAEFPDLKVVLTGGDAIFFAKKLKKTIFVVANLVLVGLNRILEHNEE